MKILDYVSPYVCVYEDEKINFFFKDNYIILQISKLESFPLKFSSTLFIIKRYQIICKNLSMGMKKFITKF